MELHVTHFTLLRRRFCPPSVLVDVLILVSGSLRSFESCAQSPGGWRPCPPPPLHCTPPDRGLPEVLMCAGSQPSSVFLVPPGTHSTGLE